jgi:SOS-response transcriptional repressor LexA
MIERREGKMAQHSGEMIKTAMRKKKITQVELARRIGRDQTLISKYLSGHIEISDKAARAMARVLDMDFETLHHQLQRDRLRRKQEHLMVEFKEVLEEEEIDMSDGRSSVGAATLMESAGIIAIPLLDSVASVLRGQRRQEGRKYFLPPGIQVDAERAFALKVAERNMTDDVVDEGDIIVVDPGAEAQDGDRVLVILKGKPGLRRLYHRDKTIVLQSQDEPILFLSPRDNFEIIGRMVLCNKIFAPQSITD